MTSYGGRSQGSTGESLAHFTPNGTRFLDPDGAAAAIHRRRPGFSG